MTLPGLSRILAVSVTVLITGCGGGNEEGRRPADADTLPASRVPAGRLPEGAVYDFGSSRGGPADVAGAYFMGRRTAPVTVATFGDFQCRFCARSQEATAAAREELVQAGTVRILYLDFPLGMHPRSGAAAEFARCVGAVEGGATYWRAHEALHQKQERWSAAETAEAGLREVAGAIGASWPEVSACMASDAELPAIRRFRELGRRLGVRGTPTSFFNGMPKVGVMTAGEFRERVADARDPGPAR